MSLLVVALLSFYPVSSVLICARIWDHPLDHGNFTVPHSPNRVSLSPLADSHCHQLLREGRGRAGDLGWNFAWSCAGSSGGNHSCCRFINLIAMSCPNPSSSRRSFPSSSAHISACLLFQDFPWALEEREYRCSVWDWARSVVYPVLRLSTTAPKRSFLDRDWEMPRSVRAGSWVVGVCVEGRAM